MIKIVGIIFITLILIILFRKINKEVAILITVASTIIIFISVSNDLNEIIDNINNLSSQIGDANSFVSLLIKVLGVSLITQFIGDLCRDSGETTLANQTEIASKIIILIMTMPLFETVINIVSGLLK